MRFFKNMQILGFVISTRQNILNFLSAAKHVFAISIKPRSRTICMCCDKAQRMEEAILLALSCTGDHQQPFCSVFAPALAVPNIHKHTNSGFDSNTITPDLIVEQCHGRSTNCWETLQCDVKKD